ncbi:hypothetical protein WH285_10885 [Acinetobacter johnsonii]|uniref:hypothetical protein n=1 Tax=Acinetobacter johnsonii TaxID=40214 RepID=UPI0030996488
MVASTDIKFYVHSNNNAPQLQNAYGSMIGVLDACLVNGISLGPVSTLTAVGTIVTAVFSAAHNLMQYQVLKITGANQAEYNGEHRILTVPNATSVTFQLAGTPSVTTATGAMTATLPPLGWEKPFSSVNEAGGGKAAYRSKNVLLASRPYLRVVDELDPAYSATYAKYAKVGIVEDMADINTLLGVQAPFDATSPDKNWQGINGGTTATSFNGWAKWYYARGNHAGVSGNQFDITAPITGIRSWMVIGTKDYFYILPSLTGVNTNQVLYGFGAFESLINPDTATNFLVCSDRYFSISTSNGPAASAGMHATNSVNQDYSNLLVQRKYDNSAKYNNARCGSFYALNSSFYSASQNYVEPFNGDVIFSPIYIFDYFEYSGSKVVTRGKAPLINWIFNTSPYSDLSFIEKNGKTYMAKSLAVSGGVLGQILIEIGEV